MLFGVLIALDAGLGLIPNTVFWFQEASIAAGIGQPPWLSGWFAFWLAQANTYGTIEVALVTALEFALAMALILGFLRKVAYFGGIALLVLIWATVGGFGGPYDPGTFDIGAGIIYAIGFLFLIGLDAALPPDHHTLDARIARRWPNWARWAEVSSSVFRPSGGAPRRPHEAVSNPRVPQDP